MRLSFRYRFESAHRFLSSESPRCQTPHGHTWWVRLDVASTAKTLNSHDMVEEFGELKKEWRSFIEDTVDHSFLHHQTDPLLPALKDFVPAFRGLAFPGDPTTEMVAVLFLRKAQVMIEAHNLRRQTSLQAFSVTIDETPTNSVSVDFESPLFLETVRKISDAFKGWWNEASPASRLFDAL